MDIPFSFATAWLIYKWSGILFFLGVRLAHWYEEKEDGGPWGVIATTVAYLFLGLWFLAILIRGLFF